MLENKRIELNEKVHNLAFHYYIRNGQVPPLVAAMVAVTSEAMTAVGGFNKYWERNTDTSGAYGTDASENTFIPMGYNDYTSGRITLDN